MSRWGDRPTKGTDEGELHRLMVGRVRTENYYREHASATSPARRRRGWSSNRVGGAGVLHDASFEVAPGEIVGLAGTEGSGKRVLGEIIAGVVRPTAGRVLVDGLRCRAASATTSAPGSSTCRRTAPTRSDHVGVDHRQRPVGLAARSIRDQAGRAVGRRRARKVTERFVDELGIVAEGIDAPVSSLSGGNAQKVLIAKWLLRQPDVLVLDEPTQGVDTGAREGIYDLLRQVAAAAPRSCWSATTCPN